MQDCPKKLQPSVVERNARKFAAAIAKKETFIPVQVEKTSVKVKSKDGGWNASELARMCGQIPMPLAMTNDNSSLTLQFSSETDAKQAFNVLRLQGLQLEGCEEFLNMNGLHPIATSSSSNVATDNVEQRFRRMEERMNVIEKHEERTEKLLLMIVDKMGDTNDMLRSSIAPRLKEKEDEKEVVEGEKDIDMSNATMAGTRGPQPGSSPGKKKGKTDG